MLESPATRATLLQRIRDGQDHEAWNEFTAIYAPAIYSFGRKKGLQDADAADLMQEVFRAVALAAQRFEYDSQRGSFRGWLYTITRNKLFSFLERRQRTERGTGDSDAHLRLEEAESPSPDAEVWDQEYERKLIAAAMDRVRPEFQPATWQAFWSTGIEGLDAAAAARLTGLSVGAVYVAKSRVLARIKKEVQRLQQGEEG